MIASLSSIGDFNYFQQMIKEYMVYLLSSDLSVLKFEFKRGSSVACLDKNITFNIFPRCNQSGLVIQMKMSK